MHKNAKPPALGQTDKNLHSLEVTNNNIGINPVLYWNDLYNNGNTLVLPVTRDLSDITTWENVVIDYNEQPFTFINVDANRDGGLVSQALEFINMPPTSFYLETENTTTGLFVVYRITDKFFFSNETFPDVNYFNEYQLIVLGKSPTLVSINPILELNNSLTGYGLSIVRTSIL